MDGFNYDERLELFYSVTNPDNQNNETFGINDEGSPFKMIENYINFGRLFNNSSSCMPENGWHNGDVQHEEMISHIQNSLPLHILNTIDGARSRVPMYDDQGFPTRE